MKQKTSNPMNDYKINYINRRKKYNRAKVGYESEQMKEEKFELDIMKLAVKKYNKERRTYGRL